MPKDTPIKDTETFQSRRGKQLGQPGRPKGQIARNTARELQRSLIARLTADFKKNGIKTIEEARKKDPVAYLKIVTQLLPKDVNLNIEHTFSDVLMDAQAKIAARERERVIEGEVIKEVLDE